jgi:hypothetical protein
VFVLSSSGDIIAQAQAGSVVRYLAAQDLDGDGLREVLVATDGPMLTAWSYRAR